MRPSDESMDIVCAALSVHTGVDIGCGGCRDALDAFARAAVVGELERLHRVTFGEFGVWDLDRVRAAILKRAAELEKETDNAKD